ncbi:MAG: hypothetical protein ABH952_06520 [Candidatus Omnitrophota bacterium]
MQQDDRVLRLGDAAAAPEIFLYNENLRFSTFPSIMLLAGKTTGSKQVHVERQCLSGGGHR